MLPENKIYLSRIKNQGLSRWQRDALPLSYARLFFLSNSLFII